LKRSKIRPGELAEPRCALWTAVQKSKRLVVRAVRGLRNSDLTSPRRPKWWHYPSENVTRSLSATKGTRTPRTAVFCSRLLGQLTTRVLDMSYFGGSWRWGGLLPAKLGLLANANVLSPLEQTVRDSEVGELPVRRRGLRERTFGAGCFRVVLRSHLLAPTSSL
jgi:hypothetical protein